jgi:hypothetical protein
LPPTSCAEIRVRERTIAWWDPAPPPTAEFFVEHFHQLARAIFERYRRDLTLRGILGRSLRRGERDIWWPEQLFGKRSLRSLSTWTVRSALLICDAAGVTPDDLAGVVGQARRRASHFQLSYNLARYWSRRRDVSRALTWLETSLERANSWQLTDGWLDVDPDLAPVRSTARYAWVAEQVRSTADEGKADADGLQAVAA